MQAIFTILAFIIKWKIKFSTRYRYNI